jgi:hypothetical protein
MHTVSRIPRCHLLDDAAVHRDAFGPACGACGGRFRGRRCDRLSEDVVEIIVWQPGKKIETKLCPKCVPA